jgi:hypothetical protein
MAVNSNTIDMGIHNTNGRQFEVVHDEDPTKSSRGVEAERIKRWELPRLGRQVEGKRESIHRHEGGATLFKAWSTDVISTLCGNL